MYKKIWIVYHRCEVRVKMWVMNLGKPVEVPKLNETMAIELGATLLGEFIIFSSGAVLVIAEVVRQNKKATAQKQREMEEMQAIVDRLRDLEIETSRHDAQLREVNRLCASLQGVELSQEQLKAIASQLQQATSQEQQRSVQAVQETSCPPSPPVAENKGIVKTALQLALRSSWIFSFISNFVAWTEQLEEKQQLQQPKEVAGK